PKPRRAPLPQPRRQTTDPLGRRAAPEQGDQNRVRALPLPRRTPNLAAPRCATRPPCTYLLQSGVDITVIALWLGHEDTATTHSPGFDGAAFLDSGGHWCGVMFFNSNSIGVSMPRLECRRRRL